MWWGNFHVCTTRVTSMERLFYNSNKTFKPGIEITTFLDVPYSTGLGSSSSFTVGLLKCLLAYKNKKIDPYKLSKYSINIERCILNNYGGIQDQIASAYGGFREVIAKKKYNFISRKMNISRDTISILSENLFLFYTGVTRSSSNVQKNVKKKILTNPKLLNYYHEIKELAYKSKNALVRGDVDEYGKLMNKHWIAKNKTLKNTDKLNNFDEIYSKCISLGALGGKIIGAGAGGFFLVYLNKKNNSPLKLKRLMAKYNYIELPFQFSEEGASVSYL